MVRHDRNISLSLVTMSISDFGSPKKARICGSVDRICISLHADWTVWVSCSEKLSADFKLAQTSCTLPRLHSGTAILKSLMDVRTFSFVIGIGGMIPLPVS